MEPKVRIIIRMKVQNRLTCLTLGLLLLGPPQGTPRAQAAPAPAQPAAADAGKLVPIPIQLPKPMFEGTPQQMWTSLSKYRAVPDETLVYCAHEYTQSNARFALTVEPGNAALQARAVEAEELAKKRQPALPTTIERELATNPFLRPSSPEIQKRLGMEGRELWEVFGETRRRKDKF